MGYFTITVKEMSSYIKKHFYAKLCNNRIVCYTCQRKCMVNSKNLVWNMILWTVMYYTYLIPHFNLYHPGIWVLNLPAVQRWQPCFNYKVTVYQGIGDLYISLLQVWWLYFNWEVMVLAYKRYNNCPAGSHNAVIQ
jgi:hypothetical protein